MLHQGTKARVYEKLLLSLTNARRGRRELDIVLTFILGDTTSEAGKMIELLVEEGYPWDVISELLDEDLPAYTSSLDAALPGENVTLSAFSKKRKQWVAVHRAKDGTQISAWAATECLARRLAGLQACKKAIVPTAQARATPRRAPVKPVRPGMAATTPVRAPVKPAAVDPEAQGEEEWRILF